MILQVLLAVVLAAGVAALFWFLSRDASHKIGKQFAALAERFDLELVQPPAQLGGFVRPEPHLHGLYRGRELSLSVPGKGLQNTRQIETVLKLAISDALPGFQVTASGLMGRLRQRDSDAKGRWLSGDTAFDETLDLRTGSPEEVEAVLEEEARECLLRLLRGSKATLYAGKGVLAYARLGLVADDAARRSFEDAVEILCDFADAVDGTPAS